MKYRLLTNSDGKFQAQYRSLSVPWINWLCQWEYIQNKSGGHYAIVFDTMDSALEAIAEHKAAVEAENWTPIDLPD